MKRKQIEKYILIGVIMALLIISLSNPKISYYSSPTLQRTGEVMLLIDVSGSMAARENIDSPSRLERIKPILYDMIDNIGELVQVKISLYGFTEITRSLVPFVETDDYQYLKESIDKVLDIYATPGSGSSLGKSLQNAIPRFSEDAQSKLIILISDGEAYINDTRGMTYHERLYIDEAIEQAIEEDITIITVGVGEKAGAKIPLFNSDGEFTGEYSKLQKEAKGKIYTSANDYVTYLEEEGLKEIANETGGEYFFENSLDGLNDLIAENLTAVNDMGFHREVINYFPINNWFSLATIPIWILFVKRHILE
ncbi:MAG: vWA domain-containing protein [Eubacteriales bacterium]